VPKSDVHARAQREHLVEEEVAAIAEVVHALAAPSRVRLLYALREGELAVGELAARTGLHPSAASQQLRVLRHLRLVATRREGRSIRYRLHDAHVASLLDEVRHHVEHARLGWTSPAPAARRSDEQMP
jgi:ArsR family transcriptional regulator, nickel/cobalt-responsive transcriptional repressor